jgi:hypothetical protein
LLLWEASKSNVCRGDIWKIATAEANPMAADKLPWLAHLYRLPTAGVASSDQELLRQIDAPHHGE